MVRPRHLRNTIAATALLLAAAPMSAPAHATGSCGSGPWIATAAAGTLEPGGETWYRVRGGLAFVDVVSSGPVTLRLVSNDCSTVLCEHSGAFFFATCGATSSGQVNVSLTNTAYTQVAYTALVNLGMNDGDYPVPVPEVAPECRDGRDNDLNGQTDYPDDPRCSSPDDDSESDPVLCATVPVCVTVDDNAVLYDVTDYEYGAAGDEPAIGAIDIYDFDLPGGLTYGTSCVVLTVNGTEVNPCKAAGGRFFYRVATLTEGPAATAGHISRRVGICSAEYTVTVAATEVVRAPGYSVC